MLALPQGSERLNSFWIDILTFIWVRAQVSMHRTERSLKWHAANMDEEQVFGTIRNKIPKNIAISTCTLIFDLKVLYPCSSLNLWQKTKKWLSLFLKGLSQSYCKVNLLVPQFTSLTIHWFSGALKNFNAITSRFFPSLKMYWHVLQKPVL